ncbi:hypothetical protein [Halobellus inordinatus]|uniref:hypothetical protein n=1 Tax=Halobellus inordinatus TaxID=1126236 RepID=UPI00210CE0BF|nr:hypothetical protein [Halobellus inordinatus]
MAPRLDRALTYINKADTLGGFGESFVAGAGGLVLAIFSIVIGVGEAFANLITSPVDAFAAATSALISAGFGAPAEYLQDVWNTAAVALGMDPWLSLGPFVVVVGVGAMVAGLAPMLWYLDVIDADTFTGIDLPIIGLDTGGDLDDEN